MKAGYWLGLLLLSVLWGSAYFFFQILAHDLPPLVTVLGRVGVAAVLLTALCLAMGWWPRLSVARWRDFLVVAMLSNVVPFALTAWAEDEIPGGLASILNATTPAFTIMVAWLAGQEKITWNKLIGLGMGLIGVAVLVGPSALKGGGSHQLPAIGAVLLAAISYALAGVYGQRFSDLKPVQAAAAQLVASTLITLPFAFAIEHPWTIAMPSLAAIGALLGIALIATAAAYVLYYRILFDEGPTNLLLVTLLMPVTALVLGIAFLGEKLTLWAIAGSLVIGLSLVAIDGRLLGVERDE